MAKRNLSTPHGIQVIQWLAWADEDYLAARMLLIRGFLVQGAIFANTAIEKYMKAALVARGVSFRNTHDVTSLYRTLKSSGRVAPLDAEFLTTLGKAYSLRYPDDLTAGFNISLAQVKILAETDATVHALRSGFGFQRADGLPVITRLDTLLVNKDVAFLEKNAAFGGCTRAEVFANPTLCFEMRLLDGGSILEATYQAGPIPDDGIYNQEGLKLTASIASPLK
ncbi:MAG TPA: HEPN domain-containing protein [Terriglobales bacterium]|jgi:HEPN domain-containing protein|nr:HEPN domain-containing protein [Terriglobales bacterium]